MGKIQHIIHEEDVFEVYGTRQNNENEEEFLIYERFYGGWKWVSVSEFRPYKTN
ncbi:hypothetical protein ABES74_09660 [Bacillus subtilis]|uniref:DUF1653 domain-containing protein n=1 Tax=Bacillus spizizenii TaxID=96241 RepID=A0A9Q4DRF3_BACSC|nr:hypothetical protein [Bacillus spizizenii]MCY8122216.1 hypothetical protein [Bacillus spizizenii]MCY9259094.1 hypothetical protein [Bacillus spizizenii]MCY9425585.1 hypothetical protein [Bacillus spizizenii]MCY9429306.1 hypothetical protein [Bacillus spizizenii]